MTKQITLTVLVDQLTPDLVDQIFALAEETKQEGEPTCLLKFRLIDVSQKMEVTMPSKKLKVFPSNQFMQAIVDLEPFVRMKLA